MQVFLSVRVARFGHRHATCSLVVAGLVAGSFAQLQPVVPGGAFALVALDALGAVLRQVVSSGEHGLLGLTFSPDGSKLYVHYSAAGSGDTTLDEYTYTDGQVDVGASLGVPELQEGVDARHLPRE